MEVGVGQGIFPKSRRKVKTPPSVMGAFHLEDLASDRGGS